MSDPGHETPRIDPAAQPSGTGCQECLAQDGWWVHLRRCAACGHVGCCDSSPEQHGRRHFEQTSHPLVQSFEPGEDWFYDFRSDGFGLGPDLAPPTDHPEGQPVPGPEGKVPGNWQELLN